MSMTNEIISGLIVSIVGGLISLAFWYFKRLLKKIDDKLASVMPKEDILKIIDDIKQNQHQNHKTIHKDINSIENKVQKLYDFLLTEKAK